MNRHTARTIHLALVAATLSLAVAGTTANAGAGSVPSDPAAPAMRQIAETVAAYLAMVETMGEAAADPLRTQIIVQHEIKESYEKAGQPLGAIDEFRRLLDSLRHPVARVALRFAIVDVYNANGKREEALAEMRALLGENRARWEKE